MYADNRPVPPGSLCSVCSTSLSGKSNLCFVSLISVASYMSPLASIQPAFIQIFCLSELLLNYVHGVLGFYCIVYIVLLYMSLEICFTYMNDYCII